MKIVYTDDNKFNLEISFKIGILFPEIFPKFLKKERIFKISSHSILFVFCLFKISSMSLDGKNELEESTNSKIEQLLIQPELAEKENTNNNHSSLEIDNNETVQNPDESRVDSISKQSENSQNISDNLDEHNLLDSQIYPSNSSQDNPNQDEIIEKNTIQDKERNQLNEKVLKNTIDSLIDPKSQFDQIESNNTNNEILNTQNEKDDDDLNDQLKADYSTKDGEISIDTYNKYTPVTFTDHGTLAAMKSLGVRSDELFMPSEEEISQYDYDNEFKEVFVSHHLGRIDRLCTLISRERCRILDKELNTGQKADDGLTAVSSNDGITERLSGVVEMEIRSLDKLKNRQKREVEAMLENLLQMEKFQRQMNEAEQKEAERRKQMEMETRIRNQENHERHLQRLRELEELEQKKLKEEENKRMIQFEKEKRALEAQKRLEEEKLFQLKENERLRLERVEQNRQTLQRIEEDRQARITASQQKIQEREIRRLQKLQEENERINHEKQILAEKRARQVKAAKDYERKMLEKKRQDFEEKERINAEKQKELAEQRKHDLSLFVKEQENKIKRYIQNRTQIEKNQQKMRESKIESDEDIKKRLESIEKMKEEKQLAARLSRSDGAIRSKLKQMEYKKYLAQKQAQMDEQMRKSQMKFQQAKEEKERLQKLRALQWKLKQDEQKQNQLHLQRQMQAKSEMIKRKMDTEAERVKKIEHQKLQLKMERQQRIRYLRQQKQEVSNEMIEFQVKNKVDMNSVHRLAKKYDIDIEAMKARINKR